MTHVVIAGGTGLTGSLLVEQLIMDKQIKEIVIISRRQLAYTSDKVRVEVMSTFDDLEALANVVPVAAWVFCLLGTTMAQARSQVAFKQVDAEMPVLLARAAYHAGASGFSVVSAASANRHGFFFYNRVKGEMERGVQRSRVTSIQIFRPALIVGKRKKARLGELIGKYLFAVINPFLVGGWAKYQSITAEKLANCMVRKAHQHKPGTTIIQGKALLG